MAPGTATTESRCRSGNLVAASPLALLPTAVLLLNLRAPMSGWVLMWSLATAVFLGCKWLTLWTSRVHTTGWRRVAYLLTWPGMDADAFLDPRRTAAPVSARAWAPGVLAVLAGCAAIWAGVRAAAGLGEVIQGWIGMVGIVWLLHFGAFRLVSCAWRCAGVEAHVLMDRPLSATSLGAFWGRQWNTAFRDLTHRFLYVPLARRWGSRRAVVAGFVVSGVVHDLVISVPARAGYGLPTCFFLLQAVGVLLERSASGRRLGAGRGIAGWAWTMLVVAGPAALLFHPPFIHRVIVPFLDVLHAR
jgi:hypothetical protein